MKLRDIMRRFPKTVNVDDTLEFARDMMVWMELRHLPVTRDGKLVGVLTERNLAVYQAAIGDSYSTSMGDKVESAMQPEPQTAHPDDPVVEAAGRMAAAKIGCLPITEKGALIGLVTTTDLLAAQVRNAMEPPHRAGPTVGDVMTHDPLAVHPDDYVINAAARMQQRNIRHLPVVDGDRTVLGMLSDRDVRAAIGDPTRALDSEAEESPDETLHRLRVRDAMTRPVVTTTPDQSCAAMAREFVSLRGSAVPVTNKDGRLIGILSYIDILRGLADAIELRGR
ncbi:MAG: CBS domain-containing protein [Proteobacteria bacterium]|nr:CBS domain-containing protein [Pseudomonadota bacterium]